MDKFEIDARLNNIKTAVEMGMISMKTGIEVIKDLLLEKHSAILDAGDEDTVMSRSLEKDIKEAMDSGILDIKINGKKATDVDVAIDEDTGVIVITNGDGETTEIIISVPQEYII